MEQPLAIKQSDIQDYANTNLHWMKGSSILIVRISISSGMSFSFQMSFTLCYELAIFEIGALLGCLNPYSTVDSGILFSILNCFLVSIKIHQVFHDHCL